MGSIPVQRWCLPWAPGEHLFRSLNSNELLRCTQLRTTSQQMLPNLDPLTVPLGDAESTFLMLGCGITCQKWRKLEGSGLSCWMDHVLFMWRHR